MTGETRTEGAGTGDADDERRWAEALALLARTADEHAERRLRRALGRQWLLVSLLVLGGLAVSLAVVLLARDALVPDDPGPDQPTWRVVTGFSLSGLGLLGLVVGVVVQIRDTRRLRGFRSPLHVLTRRQRKQLLAEVRGRAAAVAERVPLGRHQASLLLVQRTAIAAQTGMTVNFLGQWIAWPRPYLLVTATVLVVVQAGALGLMARDWRRARRYLVRHPAPVAGPG